ncbi:MAG TPA: hypothetical protein VIS99_15765, partial [Terrimicrobiaceae bacterium]
LELLEYSRLTDAVVVLYRNDAGVPEAFTYCWATELRVSGVQFRASRDRAHFSIGVNPRNLWINIVGS